MVLRGQARLPNTNRDPRIRRNASNLLNPKWISVDEVVSLTGDGKLTITLASNGGLQNVSGALSILLAAISGLSLTGGLAVKLADTRWLQLTSSGLNISETLEREHRHAFSQPMLGIAQTAHTHTVAEEVGEEALVQSATIAFMGL